MAEHNKKLLETVTEQVKDKLNQNEEGLENFPVFQSLLKNSMIVDENNFLATVMYGYKQGYNLLTNYDKEKGKIKGVNVYDYNKLIFVF